MQVLADGLLKGARLVELAAYIFSEPCHLLRKRLPIIFLVRRTHIPPRREDVVMFGDFFESGGFAESGLVLVAVVAFPFLKSAGNLRFILVGEVAEDAVFHVAEVAGVDEEDLARAVAEIGALLFISGEEPDAGGDLGVGEELAGEGDHAFDEVGFEEGFADFAFAAGVGGHGAVGEEEGHGAIGGEVVEHVLHPGEVGVALGRGAVFPAGVALEFAVPPFLDVEGGIGHDVVGAEVGVLVVGEAVGGFFAEVEVDAPDGHVHGGEAPGGGVGFLAVDGEVAELAAVFLDEFLALDEEAAGAHGGVVYATLEGLEHLDDEGDDGLRGEVLAALLTLGEGKLTEEIFVDVAEDVLGVEVSVLKWGWWR